MACSARKKYGIKMNGQWVGWPEQERKRLADRSSFSCSCESAEALADADSKEEEEFLLR